MHQVLSSRVRIVLGASMLLAVVVVSGLMPARQASAAAYRCGSQCNGKSPSYVIPSNGIVCSKSQKLIRTGYPYAARTQAYDRGLVIRTYYSTVCQTMWVTVSASSPRPTILAAAADISRTLKPYVQYTVPYPAAGKKVTSVMVDDYSPTKGIAANFSLTETFKGMRNDEINYSYSSSY